MSDASLYVHAARGQTAYNGRTIDTNDLQDVRQEGFSRVFPNENPPTAGGQIRTRRGAGVVRARWMRNTSGYTLLPKRLVKHAAGYYNKRFDGYTRTTAEHTAGVIDEFLPATGVVTNDCCWVVQQGQTLVTSYNTDSAVDFVYGAMCYAGTAATSGSTGGLTTGGKFLVHNVAGTFTSTATTDGTGGLILANKFGRCASTGATSSTATDFLVDVNVL
jgi:hypothetical protein